MTRNNIMKNFLKNFSSYEISFLAENIIYILGIIMFWKTLNNIKINFILSIIIIIISLLLNTTIIGINFMKRKSYNTIKVSLKLDRYFIYPINIIKIIILISFSYLLYLQNYYSFKLFLIILGILVLESIANIKYYAVLINMKEEVINKR